MTVVFSVSGSTASTIPVPPKSKVRMAMRTLPWNEKG